MWSISEMKERGKAAFKKNYWRSVLVAFILTLLTTGSSLSGQAVSAGNTDPSTLPSEQLAAVMGVVAMLGITYVIIWSLLRLFLLNPLEVGCCSFLKKNITEDTMLDELKAGFDDYKRSVLTILLRDVFLALWFCLLFIPGIIKSYSYMMVPYIVNDEPDLSPKEVIDRSKEMMKGNKWRAFLLDLSFIGWAILSALTAGLVGTFYSEPYRRSAKAALYLELK